MIPLLVDPNFSLEHNWVERTSGAGSTSVTNGILNCQASGSDQAMRDFWVPFRPGQIFEFEVMARKIKGDGRVAIGFWSDADSSRNYDYVSVEREGWTEYKLTAFVPPHAVRTNLRFVLGKWGSVSDDVEVEFQKPKVRVGGVSVADQVLALGMIRYEASVPQWVVNNRYRAFGIDSLNFNGTDTLTVQLEHEVRSDMCPHILVTGTPGEPIVPLAGALTPGPPTTFEIKWTDGSQIVDVAANGSDLYVSLRVCM